MLLQTKPTVHLNGTSREALIEGYTEAGEALFKAISALVDASPNARDYYPQGPEAFRAAQREHEARIAALQNIRREVMMLAEHVASGA